MKTLKRYKNRKIYDPRSSSYVSYPDIVNMILRRLEFRVVDATTGKNITSEIIMKAVAQEEGLLNFDNSVVRTNTNDTYLDLHVVVRKK